MECCKVLLQNGANPNMRMRQGWTPAHCAAEIGNIEVLKLLMEFSGSVVFEDLYGATPKDVADTYGHIACYNFLSE